MKTYINIQNARALQMQTYVLVSHSGSSKRYLFRVPDGLELKCGDTVLCETIKGKAIGIAGNTFELSDSALMELRSEMRFYPPVKEVIGRVILPDSEQLPF